VYLNSNNNNNNNSDNFIFSIEFSTEIILLCIKIRINIISEDRNSIAAIVTRCMFLMVGGSNPDASKMFRGVQTGSEAQPTFCQNGA